MHPNHISPELQIQYGVPSIKRILGNFMALYPPGNIPGWKIAQKLSYLAEGLNASAMDYYQEEQPTTIEQWEKVAQLQGIPKQGFTATYIQQKVKELHLRAKLSEITFDQAFFDTLQCIIKTYATNAPMEKTSTYPLLEGPPGASKSLAVHVFAALIGVPVFTVTGSDGSADEIKIELFGGDKPSSSDLYGLTRKYISMGWLHHPKSLEMLAKTLTTTSINELSNELLQEVAHLEKIKENITEYWPGWYPLASKNGCILFLDETNGFRGVQTLLTELLENYTADLHPNFFIIGAINPAGDKHNREPLAPEIRSRFITVPVDAPSVESYHQMLVHAFSGKQPRIRLLPTVTKAVNVPELFQVSMREKAQSLLGRVVDKAGLETLLKNLAKAHKTIEVKLQTGDIDPKQVSADGVEETRSIDRRTLVKFISTVNTYLAQAQQVNSKDILNGLQLTYEEYQELPTTDLNAEIVIDCIQKALNLLYVEPFKFPLIDIDPSKQQKVLLASDLVTSILEQNKLDTESLMQYVKTTSDLREYREAWLQAYRAYAGYQEEYQEYIVTLAQKLNISPDMDYAFFKDVYTNKPTIVNFEMLGLSDPMKHQTYQRTIYGQVLHCGHGGNKVSLAESFMSAKDTLEKTLKLRPCNLQEIHRTTLDEYYSKYPQHCILTLMQAKDESLSLVLRLPEHCCVNGETKLLMLSISKLRELEKEKVINFRMLVEMLASKLAPSGIIVNELDKVKVIHYDILFPI